MKIKVENKTYDEVLALKPFKNKRPAPQGKFWRFIMKTASASELKKVGFTCNKIGMEKLPLNEPALYLMNHSSFIDLKIASTIIYPKPFHIVCTLDGFVGKESLMRKVGCIPTRKFMADTALVRDMLFTAQELKESVLLYPEASYTFDGTATPLPDSLGKAIKKLELPVVMIKTYGAFGRDPLYNNLQIRDVKVSADMTYLLSKEDLENLSVEEINNLLKEQFTFDNFKWQQDNNVVIDEGFRADHLDRVLYKCPHCMAEGKTVGKGTTLKCEVCGAEYELTELGKLERISADGVEAFSHVPDWYAWERQEVRKEIEAGTYLMEEEVEIIMLVNTDAVYRVGDGVLRHDAKGFHLTGCDGKLDYTQSPELSYSLYSDYYWYELGDMISIGTPKVQYYCFPKNKDANVAKARLAVEELYKLTVKGEK